MGTAILFALGMIALVAIGLLTVSSVVRDKWRSIFPSRKAKAKLRILDKGLTTAGFYDPIDDPDKVVVIENEYLSEMIGELHKDDELDLYVEMKDLKISNNRKKEVGFGWLLCSDTHAIGFNIK